MCAFHRASQTFVNFLANRRLMKPFICCFFVKLQHCGQQSRGSGLRRVQPEPYSVGKFNQCTNVVGHSAACIVHFLSGAGYEGNLAHHIVNRRFRATRTQAQFLFFAFFIGFLPVFSGSGKGQCPDGDAPSVLPNKVYHWMGVLAY